MISKSEFVKRLAVLPKSIPSKTKKASYTGFNLQGSVLSFQRVNTGRNWRVDIEELYYAYLSHRFINTSVLKNISPKRVNSPSVAILMAIGAIDEIGNRI